MTSERIAMVGAGYFAQFQLEGWQDAGAPVLALCDIAPGRADALARRFQVPHAYTQVAAMLDEQQPTLLDLVLPPQAQAEVVAQALEGGIPTICQKPFGTDLAQARHMAALAEAQNTLLVVHENFRFTPWFRECRRLIGAGHLGRLHGITFRLRPGDGPGPDAYLQRQHYFQTMTQLLVRETAVHFIDTFRYLMGEVRAVTARLRRLNPVIAAEDAALIVFEFADDALGLFDGNRLNDHVAENPRRTMGEMWLEGERGVLRLDGAARLWWKPHHGPESEHLYASGACTALQAHVLAHLGTGTPVQNCARDYLENLRIQAAIYQSHATGSRVPMAAFTPQPTP